MTNFKLIAAAILTGGALLVTMPFELEQSMPGAVINSQESPTLIRTGVVTEVVEADNIVVRVSGSNVLVQASYLWPQYEPLMGDRVYITKQDAQWFVHGTMAGPLNSLANNASFEEGTVGATPTDWSATVVASPAGVPTFHKEFATSVAGNYIGTFRNVSAGAAGTSRLDVFSAFTPADINDRVALGFFVTYVVPDVNASLTPQGGFTDLSGYIQFYDAANVFISETLATYSPFYSSLFAPAYVRTFGPAGERSIVAPANTAKVRIRFRGNFTMHVNSITEIGIDAAMLRIEPAP